ncbi:MAG: alkaline phosphatase family protein [Burkholderiales bacterium]
MPLHVQPDYEGGSIVNLMATLAAGLGASAPYAPLAELPVVEVREARNVVLLVADGLGARWLARLAPDGALRARQRAVLTSVFPSTTATAVTTFLTGLAPAQHGLTGWHMYFRELGAVAAILPLTLRPGGQSIATKGVAPEGLFGYAPFVAKIAASGFVVSPESIVNSPFNVRHSGAARRVGYRSLDGLLDATTAIARRGRERQYVYAYYSEIDATAHKHGMASEAIAAEVAKLDAAFGRFLASIAGTDTLVLVTADHGFVDVAPGHQIELADHGALAETLVLPLCGEPRVAYCYVHPGREAQFERYVATVFADAASLFRSQDLLAQGWFGPGVPHPRLHERVGHYTLVMKDGYAIRDLLLDERRHDQIGVHGGATEDEMLVPLVVAHV